MRRHDTANGLTAERDNLRGTRISRPLLVGLTALLLAAVMDSTAEACPNCRDALAGDPVQAGLVRGFFWSIIFMLSMPFLILAGLSSYFYWEVCRARRAAARQAIIDDATVRAPDTGGGHNPFASVSTESSSLTAPPQQGGDGAGYCGAEAAEALEPVA